MLMETPNPRKHQIRQRLKADIEHWLAQGNQIKQLPSHTSNQRLMTRREHNEHLYHQRQQEQNQC
ncbi:hypothetical protein SAMN05660443_0212 [Marinospirillum celere]|uniref:Uncharacterized protein n=1 Tax=Marinospirillum celere TaxID=1122252 RepID=A0A1I1E4I1_9GAMM|nr:hypothetical protein [Marinospirillum celere]SFB80118.1 hypothetical protein SAMN05660443_0212 [Marinospirillum celere]